METLYAGIDLHSTNSLVVVTNDKDEVVYRRRLRNRLDDVLAALAPFQERLRGVVVESTYNWYWLVDGLMDHGHRVHLANTGAIQQYSGLKYGNDESDARCVGSARLSNGKKKGKGNPKNGNKYLGWAFIEAASFAVRYNETIQAYYQRKAAKVHLMVAKKAVAHKLARACYHILRDQTTFDVDKAFA